jgi:hypothetical protein
VTACHDSAIELQYRKAVRCDADAVFMLRQLETYWPYYDEIGRGERIYACPLCRYGKPCELCYLFSVSAAVVVAVSKWLACRRCCCCIACRRCCTRAVAQWRRLLKHHALCHDSHVQRWPKELPPGPFGRRLGLAAIEAAYAAVWRVHAVCSRLR